MSKFYKLKVIEKKEEAKDTVSLVFAAHPAFSYEAGQHIPFRFFIDGKQARRTYTISSSPTEDNTLKITVKRVKGGLVSNYINDHVKEGDFVDGMPPIGHIFVRCNRVHYKTYYLFAAGSGITPMMSILKTVLGQEPHSHVFLFYGNRNEEHIIFRDELDALTNRYQGRLRVVHTLSKPKKDTMSAFWSWKGVMWDVRTGRVDDEAVRWFIDTYRPVAQDVDYFICGPNTMNANLKATLLSLLVPEEDIHVEYFKAPDTSDRASPPNIVDQAKAFVQLEGQQVEVTVAKNRTVLQALVERGYDPPYACESGICATCRAKLLKGSVYMASHAALHKKEINQGYILTCQAHPTSKQVKINYDGA